MAQHYHANAVTNVHIRTQLQNNFDGKSSKYFSKKLNISQQTISKWKNRNFTNDKSSRPNKIQYCYTEEQEKIIVSLRKSTWFSKEEIHEMLPSFNVENISISTIYNIFKKNNINKQPQEIKEKYKTFKEYDPGFLHIDVTYLPKINGQKTYLFVAIDRATRMIFYWIYENKNAKNAEDFLEKCLEFFPFKIEKILTDNGLEFTNKLLKSKKRKPCEKVSLFDEKCKENNVEHRLTKPFTPKTNGMVERSNYTIKHGTLKKETYKNIDEMSESLVKFLQHYNLRRRHSSLKKELKVRTPFEVLEFWQNAKPEIFKKNIVQTKNYLVNLKVIYSTTCIT